MALPLYLLTQLRQKLPRLFELKLFEVVSSSPRRAKFGLNSPQLFEVILLEDRRQKVFRNKVQL